MTEFDAERARHTLQQHLQSLRQAGLTHLPRCPEERRPMPATGERAASPTRSVDTRRVQMAASAPTSERNHDLEGPETVSPSASPTSTSDPQSRLDHIAAKVARCRRCEELARTRTQTVFGVGDPAASILFIGEAPGADEDRQGEPFVGRAGQLMNKIIEASQLKRSELYICNILKCRPPENRNPLPVEAEQCNEYLLKQIEIVDPDYIVCWGSVAAQNLLKTKTSIGRLRGQFWDYNGIKVLCTYHPSYLLRNPSAKKHVWDDMKFLRTDMGVEL